MGNIGSPQTRLALRLPLYIATTFLRAQWSLAIPTLLQARNVTTNETKTAGQFEPGWNSGPKSRGTMTLIFSCVITLFLCIWTTVQVNIEPENNTNATLFRIFGVQEDRRQHRDAFVKYLGHFLAKRMVRKLGWSCVTIIVPEATLAVAMYERRAAIRLTKAMKNTVPFTTAVGSGSKDSKDDDRWNMTLSYYTIMGGFYISNPNCLQHDTRPQGHQPSPKDEAINGEGSEANPDNINEQSTLTPHGVLLVQKKGLLPSIRPKDVMDKSKANKLTKVIVFFQALWMIVQVISRAADSLPVTLLELHTCVHTFCALVTYATWWDKPVDVDLATPVSVDPETLRELIKEEKTRDRDIATLSPLGERSEPERYLTSRAGLGKLMFLDLFGDARKSRGLRQGYFEMLRAGYKRLRDGWTGLWIEALAVSFVGVVYGGLHLSVWRNEFPTWAEMVLWRVASLITAVAWSGFMLTIFVGGRGLNRLYAILFGLSVFPCLSIRLYLLFESFFSLRKLPLGSYEVPVWSDIWPHVG